MIDDLPKGFKAGTASCAFKTPGRKDLGIIYSESPCVFAALFTTNLFRAAPVQICQEILAAGRDVRVIVANSGQANSCTGDEGLRNGREIQETAAKLLHVAPHEVLLLSTGVIGQQFDMEKWRSKLPEAAADTGNADAEGFTRAFMTTDAFPKFACRDVPLSQGTVRLTIMAKGAGMICPNMATMLCVALTDAKVDRNTWQHMFTEAANATFNRVTVDGDTSTNDTIAGLANGASGISITADWDKQQLQTALTDELARVAYMLVKDGEGARSVMRIRVDGAQTEADAGQIARAVGNSQLVKTAIYGGDANWGRIVNAVGYAGVAVNPMEVSLTICGIERFKAGQPVNGHREADLDKALQGDEINLQITVGSGPGQYTLLASDLGHEYVSLNADYRS